MLLGAKKNYGNHCRWRCRLCAGVKGQSTNIIYSAQEQFEIFLESEPGKIDFYSTSENGHGREEKRDYYIFDDIDELDGTEGFENLSAIGVVESTRKIGDKVTHGIRFYILSCVLTAKMLAGCIRSHWGVENKLHWSLDVTFNEDASRIRKDNSAENTSIVRRIALNLLKNNGDNKKSMRAKRKVAGWDRDYLKQVIGF